MPEEKYVSKVVLSDGRTLMDLTSDTVTPSDVAYGVTAHNMAGVPITGTSTLDSDTSDDTALASEILYGSTAHARGAALTGTMPNRGSIAETIDDASDVIVVPAGYHDGTGTVRMDSTEAAKLIPANVKEGITVFGITGTHSGRESVVAQQKTATPTFQQQTLLPDQGYDYLSQVTVNAIPVTYTDNAAGGKTVTIG